MSLSDEEAKAVQEIAKTISNYEPALRELGGFFGMVLGRPAEQVGGLVGDLFSALRIELALRFKRRVDRMMTEQGLDGPKEPVAIGVVYPLLEAASLEEEDDIQEMFAQLLVNAVSAHSDMAILKSFVSVLKTMSSLEAHILTKLVDAPSEYVLEGHMVITAGLPSVYLHHEAENEPQQPGEETLLGLANLMRNGCISGAATWGGGISMRMVSVTPFGFALIKACRPQK